MAIYPCYINWKLKLKLKYAVSLLADSVHKDKTSVEAESNICSYEADRYSKVGRWTHTHTHTEGLIYSIKGEEITVPNRKEKWKERETTFLSPKGSFLVYS